MGVTLGSVFNEAEPRDPDGKWTALGHVDLSKDQRTAILGHTTLSDELNTWLRSDGLDRPLSPPSEPGKYGRREHQDYLHGQVANLDAALAKRPTARPMRVHRTTYSSLFDGIEPGDEFSDKGYTSAAVSAKDAADFMHQTVEDEAMGDETAPRALVKIDLPAGSLARYVGGISASPNQHEVLIGRGARYQLVSKTPAPDYVNPYYDPSNEFSGPPVVPVTNVHLRLLIPPGKVISEALEYRVQRRYRGVHARARAYPVLVADSGKDFPAGLSDDVKRCPRCGAKVAKGAKRCPNGHALLDPLDRRVSLMVEGFNPTEPRNEKGMVLRPDPELQDRWAVSEDDISPDRINLIHTTKIKESQMDGMDRRVERLAESWQENLHPRGHGGMWVSKGGGRSLLKMGHGGIAGHVEKSGGKYDAYSNKPSLAYAKNKPSKIGSYGSEDEARQHVEQDQHGSPSFPREPHGGYENGVYDAMPYRASFQSGESAAEREDRGFREQQGDRRTPAEKAIDRREAARDSALSRQMNDEVGKPISYGPLGGMLHGDGKHGEVHVDSTVKSRMKAGDRFEAKSGKVYSTTGTGTGISAGDKFESKDGKVYSTLGPMDRRVRRVYR